MARVILVGGAGFIGQSVARELDQRGHEACVLDSPRRLARLSREDGGREHQELNWKDHSGLRRVLQKSDVIIHLAWSSTPADSMSGICDDAEINILRSIRLLEAAQSAAVPRFMFASSGGTVYGNSLDQCPRVETDATNPVSAYGVSKLAVERYVDLYARKNNTIGINLRMGNPYGPDQYRGATVGAIAHFIYAAARSEGLDIFGDGSIVRDYLYIDDLANAICLIAEPEFRRSGSYNIGSGQGTSIGELIKKISLITEKQLVVNYDTHRSMDVSYIVLDCESLSSLTGWRPKTDLLTGLKIMWRHANKEIPDH